MMTKKKKTPAYIHWILPAALHPGIHSNSTTQDSNSHSMAEQLQNGVFCQTQTHLLETEKSDYMLLE